MKAAKGPSLPPRPQVSKSFPRSALQMVHSKAKILPYLTSARANMFAEKDFTT